MRKTIDYGKIISLHNAGWSGDKYNTALTDLLDRLDAKIKCTERQYRAVVGMLIN